MTLSTSEKKLRMLQLFTLGLSESFRRNPWIFYYDPYVGIIDEKNLGM